MRIACLCVGFAALLSTGTATADVRSLCLDNENTLWSCRAGAKHYSLCASKDLDASTGYLQYRAGRLPKWEFQFPGSQKHPKGYFKFGLMAHGASLRFDNGGYAYDIVEDIKGETSILVRTPTGRRVSIVCADSTQTLTENTTIDLLNSIGLGE